MRSATGVLPSPAREHVSPPRVSARLHLALAAGLGAGVCGYAGLYPQFDEGALRLVLGLICAPFAAAVVAASLSAKSALGAMGRAVGLAAILGMAAVVLPAAMLSKHGSGEFFAGCVFGAFLGAPTGALYGLPLGLLAAAGWRHGQAGTHDATDRAARLAGLWLVAVSLLGVLGTLLLDTAKMDWVDSTMIQPSRLPVWVASAAALGGATVAIRALLTARRRSAWLTRLRAGLEPTFRVRAIDVRDPVAALPRITDGASFEVLEWCPDDLENAGAAYRVAAHGVAVALVSDERPLSASGG